MSSDAMFWVLILGAIRGGGTVAVVLLLVFVWYRVRRNRELAAEREALLRGIKLRRQILEEIRKSGI